MPKKLKIGIVGCGAIGTSLARKISKDFRKEAALVGLFDIDQEKSTRLFKSVSTSQSLVSASLKKLIQKSDLVIEAASAKASYDISRQAIAQGKDMMIMSVGGIIDDYPGLFAFAKRHKARVFIPSGAIAGIDALKAANIAGIEKIVLTTTKNPIAFSGVKYVMEKNINLKSIKKDLVLFSGSAHEAIKYFPQNVNVAAILSIAAQGKTSVRVKIIASPKVHKNIHEIQIMSRAGNIYSRVENVLHPDNPKTSYLAYLSAVAVLKQILEPVRVGT